MIITYLLVTFVFIATDSVPQVVAGVNTIFNSSFSGVAIFWYGLVIAVVLDLITG